MNELRSVLPTEAATGAATEAATEAAVEPLIAPAIEADGADAAAAMAPLIQAEDLLEEISIDGMCGVY
ncbi:mycofactocin precursor MftA [Streptomyces sp. NPDC005820]|uniref:mycofactocin precursor MftA n=1 Tax=Streptomyces sp. NPDC005820 TaxID=3157069 RepID=UPI0033CF9A95